MPVNCFCFFRWATARLSFLTESSSAHKVFTLLALHQLKSSCCWRWGADSFLHSQILIAKQHNQSSSTRNLCNWITFCSAKVPVPYCSPRQESGSYVMTRVRRDSILCKPRNGKSSRPIVTAKL